MIKIAIEILSAWFIINLIILLLLTLLEKSAVVRRRKLGLPTAKDDGQARYIRLSEYRVNRKRKIRTDSSYWLYDNIKGTAMENRVVDFNIDNNGFIEPSGRLNCTHKFVWGGDSTTEAAIVSPEKRFPHLIEKKFREDNYDVASFNAGYSGGNIFEINLLLLCKFLPLKPTHIFVCSNIHDIHELLTNEDYIEAFIKSNQIILDSDISKTLPNRIKSALRICIPEFYTMMHVKKTRKQSKTLEDSSIQVKHVDSFELEKRIESKIRNNYKYFIMVCRDNMIKPVLMTQASMFDIESEKLLNIYNKQFNGKTDLSYQECGRIFHRVNDVIRSIAKEYDVLLIDLEKTVPLEEKYIYDLVHYSEEGCELVADIIYTYKDRILSRLNNVRRK